MGKTPVLMPERRPAGDVVVGDRVSKNKRGEYEKVIAVIPGEESLWLHLATTNPAGEQIGFYRIRPRKTTSLWVLRELD